MFSMKINASLALLGFAALNSYAAPLGPQPISCLTHKTTFSGSPWVAQTIITNQCHHPVELKGSSIQFQSNALLSGNLWGEFSDLSYPTNPKITGEKNGNQYAENISLQFPKGDKWWKPKTELSDQQSIAFKYASSPALDLKEIDSTLAVYSNTPPPPVQYGEIDFTIKQKPINTLKTLPSIVVDSKDGGYHKVLSGLSWNSQHKLTGLPDGHYAITAQTITENQQSYPGAATPSTLDITSSTPQAVAVAYKKATPSANLTVKVSQAKPDGQLPDTIQLGIKDLSSGNQLPITTLHWQQNSSISNLIIGDKYQLSITPLTAGDKQYIAKYSANPITIKAGNNNNSTVTFSQQAVVTAAVSAKVSGLPSNASSTLTLVDEDQQSYKKTIQNASSEAIANVPVSHTYTADAASYTDANGNLYTAVVSPSTFAVNSKNPVALNVNYQKNSLKFVSYWAAWYGDLFKLNQVLDQTKVNVLNLAFADYSNGKINTSVSGYIATIPKKNSQLWPSYANWTSYANKHPNTKIILSLGGATFSHIWTSELTPNTVDTMAKAIAQTIDQTYPAYDGDFAYANKKVGEVKIDGIDLDVEAGSARLSDSQSKNVIALVQALRKYLTPGKLITFAGFSVGADPEGAQCTVPKSVHCGEDANILKAVGKDFAWVNVMAYDAGLDYATSKYQIAMQNYANLIGKNKTLLGLDVQSQWQVPQPESKEALSAKAAWAIKNGYGGAMFWALTQSSKDPVDYLKAISEKF